MSNVLKGAFDIMVDPWIEYYNPSGHSNDWYLLNTSEPVKPLNFQWREPPEFTALDNPQEYQVFMKDEYYYGVRSRFNCGPAMWFLAVQNVN
jgi:phage major head subunit gpT-like protein